jgi:hypothetical protein
MPWVDFAESVFLQERLSFDTVLNWLHVWSGFKPDPYKGQSKDLPNKH